MKKSTKTILILSLLTFSNILFSCSSPSTSSSSQEVITSIEVIGPSSVLKGKTITLTASSNNVTWTTSDEYIATVDNNGIVTGVAAGTVTIRATYNEDNTLYDEIEVTVYLNKATQMDVEIVKSDDISFNNSTSRYLVPLGKEFIVKASVDESYSTPDFAFSVVYPSGVELDNVVLLTQDADDPSICRVIAYDDIENITITCKGTYVDGATATIIKSVVFDVLDHNFNNLTTVNSILDSLKEKECLDLASYKGNNSYSYKDKNDLKSSYKVSEIIESSSYSDSSLLTVKETSYDSDNEITEEKTSSYYHGINETYASSYYAFSYDEQYHIVDLYNNEASTPLSKENVSLSRNVITSSTTYGIYGILNSLINTTDSFHKGLTPFGDLYAYANAEFEFNTNSFSINSNYVDSDTDLEYEISLLVNYDVNKITSIEFKQKQISSSYEIDYVCNFNDFVYKTRENTNPVIDIDDYYMNEFSLVELGGTPATDKYDYSDTSKYGADLVTLEKGLTKYVLTTDKALVLKVDNYSPSIASTHIDRIKASSSDEDAIESPVLTGSDVFTINPIKQIDGTVNPGKATFTFVSTKGYQKQIIVEFVKADLKSVFTTNVPSNNDFGTIFKNDLSSYFYINTNPDESFYTFGIEIISGPSDGIELYEYEDGNIDGIPGFAYAIKGNKVGEYEFKIYVEQNQLVSTTDTYKIKIEEVYSASYIKSQIVGKSYSYNTSTVEYVLTFNSETKLTYSYVAYGSTINKEVNYHIEDGSIIIDSDTNLGTNAYFNYIKGGNIKFNKDFTSLQVYLGLENTITDPEKGEYTIVTYAGYSFKQKINLSELSSIIEGKEYTTSTSVYMYDSSTKVNRYMDATATVKFNNGSGTLTITTSEKTVTITFDYEVYYQKSSGYEYAGLTISNSKSNDSSFSLLSSSGDYIKDTNSFRFKVDVNYNTSYIDVAII